MPNFTLPLRPALALLATASCLAATTNADAAGGSHRASRGAAADLTIKGLEIDGSDGTIDLSARLANLGKKGVGSSTVVIALSDDNTFDENEDEILDEIDVNRVRAQGRRALEDSIDVPEDVDTSEDLHVLVCADGYGDVNERNESNNCQSVDVTVEDTATDDPTDDADPAAADGSDQ